eukprot:12435537-Heterocapsa_arctica.AAC.1
MYCNVYDNAIGSTFICATTGFYWVFRADTAGESLPLCSAALPKGIVLRCPATYCNVYNNAIGSKYICATMRLHWVFIADPP